MANRASTAISTRVAPTRFLLFCAVLILVTVAASAEGSLAANSPTPKIRNPIAASQYSNAGFSNHGIPCKRGVT